MTRLLFSSILCLFLFSSCYSLKKSVESGQPYNEQINWPQGYQLNETEFYLHNKIEIEASPQIVWNILMNAEDWPNWYMGMNNVKVVNSDTGIIDGKVDMAFNTMNRDFKARVIEYEPYERLSWETMDDDMMGVHAWLFIPTEKGCMVVTDESQYGKLAKLQKIFLPNKLRKLHDVWLEEMKIKAEAKSKKESL